MKNELSRVRARFAGERTVKYYEKTIARQEEEIKLLRTALAKAKADVGRVREEHAVSLENRLEKSVRGESKESLLQRIADLTERVALQGKELRTREEHLQELIDQVQSMGANVGRWARYRSDSRPVLRR